jgi:hypothetical protein
MVRYLDSKGATMNVTADSGQTLAGSPELGVRDTMPAGVLWTLGGVDSGSVLVVPAARGDTNNCKL